jgi:Uma2 family endonuclease
MAVPKPKQWMSAEEFDEFVYRPENFERRWELIDGEVIEVPSNPYSSEVAILISAMLVMFVRPRGLGHVTGEGAGYIVAGNRMSPDVAFVSKSRQAELVRKGYNPIAPDLMVEVLSPGNTADEMDKKIKACAKANVLLWIVDPNARSVRVHAPGQPPALVDITGILTGGSVLPELTLPVKDIFPD